METKFTFVTIPEDEHQCEKREQSSSGGKSGKDEARQGSIFNTPTLSPSSGKSSSSTPSSSSAAAVAWTNSPNQMAELGRVVGELNVNKISTPHIPASIMENSQGSAKLSKSGGRSSRRTLIFALPCVLLTPIYNQLGKIRDRCFLNDHSPLLFEIFLQFGFSATVSRNSRLVKFGFEVG